MSLFVLNYCYLGSPMAMRSRCENTKSQEQPEVATNPNHKDVALGNMQANRCALEKNVNCQNCNWVGKKNALLKHLMMKAGCTSMYDMRSLYAEHDHLKKIRKQAYDKMQYASNKDKKQQYYQEKKEERKAYQSKYDEKNREERQDYKKKYYEENKEEKKRYQRKYDEAHKQRKKEYNKLKAQKI